MERANTFRGLGLFVQPDALDREVCAALRAEMAAAEPLRAMVVRHGVAKIDDSVRRCRDLVVSEAARARVDALLAEVRPRAAEHFGRVVTRTERPHFLEYAEGDFFSSHVDDKPSSPERKISVVVFLGDEYTAGDLVLFGLFPEVDKDLGVPFRGEPGTLLAFPSDLPHEVTKVTAGRRFTVVSWYCDP